MIKRRSCALVISDGFCLCVGDFFVFGRRTLLVRLCSLLRKWLFGDEAGSVVIDPDESKITASFEVMLLPDPLA